MSEEELKKALKIMTESMTVEQIKKFKYTFFDNSGDEESFTLEDYLDLSNKVYDLERENNQLKSDLLKEEISYNNLRETYNLECDRNKKLVSRIKNDEEDIRDLLDIINHNCNELKCNSDEWLVLKGWQDRLKEGNNE